MSLANLYLKKNEEKRIKNGHLWIYSNEIDTQRSPLASFSAGELVNIVQSTGKSLGVGYINPNNLLCARLLNRSSDQPIDKSFFVHKFNIALSLRQRLFDKPFYRLVYGESDELPGLIVDRFGEHLVVQVTTAGMENFTQEISEALQKVCKPTSILFRNDTNARTAESLDRENRQGFGETPKAITIEENQTAFTIHPHDGQKTGWFYDHRQSRQQINRYVQGKRVLDVFAYIGAFGIQALKHGAAECWSIDISAKALDELEQNAELNHCAERLTCVEGDALTALKQLKQNDERFDVIIVDPPAFIKRKKDHKAGLNAYRKINEAAMRLLSRDGILLSASCSMHLKEHELQDVLRAAGRHLDKRVQIIEQCHQGPDHPIHPAIQETRYIKGFICRVLSA